MTATIEIKNPEILKKYSISELQEKFDVFLEGELDNEPLPEDVEEAFAYFYLNMGKIDFADIRDKFGINRFSERELKLMYEDYIEEKLGDDTVVLYQEDYDDLPESVQKAFDDYEENKDKIKFVNLREELGLKKC